MKRKTKISIFRFIKENQDERFVISKSGYLQYSEVIRLIHLYSKKK
jgi:hypothetical protein